jgi:hypothetical protein
MPPSTGSSKTFDWRAIAEAAHDSYLRLTGCAASRAGSLAS